MMVCCLVILFFWLLSQHVVSALRHLHDTLEMTEKCHPRLQALDWQS
jgi:hypothetical protein